MFPTFISILDIQSWWEVPSIAHFCSLFRSAFNLLDFDIEDLEEALLTDGTEESSWLQDLIVRLLSGCLPNNEISTFNYQMFLRRLFRQKCQEHDQYNPFNTDIDFQLLPLRTKVDILHALCDFRLDAEDVLDQLKNLEADSLRVEPLGYDTNDSAYWYFYGTRLYREDYTTKNNKKKAVWQVICFTEDDWFQLTKKLKKSSNKADRQLHLTLSENFLPELPRLFKEKENLARKRLLENLPRRTSSRLKKLETENEKDIEKKEFNDAKEKLKADNLSLEEETKKKDLEIRRQAAYERRSKLKEKSEDENLEQSNETMASTRSKKSKTKEKSNVKEFFTDEKSEKSSKLNKKRDKQYDGETKLLLSKPTTVGRQTNNSLSAATGQILIEPMKNTNKKKLKTSQVFRQTDEDLQTGMHKILDFVKSHEDAWPFTDPVEEEYAPNYYSIIRKPMDLQRMEERLDSGYYKNFDKFRGDFQLIVDNCKLYNGAENEYTEMVDNLQQVFQRGTDKYLDQISSSDDEIAIEFCNENNSKSKTKKSEEPITNSRRKPMLAAQTDRKRERSESETSLNSKRSRSSESPLREVVTRSTKHRKHDHIENVSEKSKKTNKSKKDRDESKKNEIKKEKSSSKKELRNKSKKASKREKEKEKEKRIEKERKIEKEKKKKIKSKPSRSPSLSPPPSDSPPPSSPDSRFDYFPKSTSKRKQHEELSDFENLPKEGKRHSQTKDLFEDIEEIDHHFDKKMKKDDPTSISPKPKDKHNKLRETIEKLKAKSEIKLKNEFEFEVDHSKENKDKTKKIEKLEKEEKHNKNKTKEKSQKVIEVELESNNTIDSVESEKLKINKPTSNMDALSIATEQTLKDINKWLDDTPKFTEFSSASNSPSYTGLDELDAITNKIDQIPGKKIDKPLTTKKEPSNSKDPKKKPFRDPSKFFKRREVQRTIDRLQPGKSKGNLIANVQNINKQDEIFPLGPLSKLKDTKNSLIVKTNTNAPKLSLGSVLDSFGKHKFDQKKESEVKIVEEVKIEEVKMDVESVSVASKKVEEEVNKEVKELVVVEDGNGGATPNLSAWFKAFGAPKIQPVTKKSEKLEVKDAEEKTLLPIVSPTTDSSQGQPVSRQRRISTGSSVSERSSFSQDMDSPRVGIDERGAYPAPYPSPLHRSPSGASPIMASPRPDISPKAAYSTINGQIRVGFYQDTVSNKSSPDKSSPRENSQSPYPHYPEQHVYTPNTTENAYYSYTNPPYYTHVPNYSSTNPTPPYNTEGNYSFYDASKSYTANSPASNQQSPDPTVVNSPIAHSQISPGLHPQHSPGVLSQHSPGVLPQHSPGVLPQHSPGVLSQHSPGVLSQHSPGVHPQHSPGVHSQHSPGVHSQHSQHSPGVHSQHSPGVLPQHSPGVLSQHSPGVHSQHSPTIYSPHSPTVLPQQSPNIQPLPSIVNSVVSETTDEQTKNDKSAFPVKKRAYNDTELPQITNQRYEIDPRLTQQIELKKISITKDKPESKSYVHQNIPDPKNINVPDEFFNKFNNSESNYPLNVPVTQDMSKYTNMGYTGPDLNTRSQSYPTTSISTSQKPVTTTYGNPNLAFQQIDYKGVKTTCSQQSLTNFATSAAKTENIADRLSTYSSSSADVARTMASLSHIVDRFNNDERMMANLQNSSSFYADKSHILNKPLSNSASGLPIFSQANMAALQSYNQSIQASPSALYNRQLTDFQNQGMLQNDLKNNQQVQSEGKKTKKRKSSKNAPTGTSAAETQPQTSTNQGFQSYAGLKGTSSLEPSAISLKTSSVVPGSAFNFGPTPAGLGISPGLYADKDGYPNFLDEFRSAPNYYMAAAAAAHHRSAPENSDKQTRPAHQNSNTQSYPFLGAPQRTSYPIASPFIPNAQAQLMDTSSPLYQHYLQAGVLNQGLLPPPGAYPPGYHPALSMRQPYDSMNRPPWL
ncbi:unnamed protein product [Psylliodes chrysocephalus]|uniref:Bromo domain-containing protein n=1 Tax=Psylliodes chrysocephalus TaxID=3402493 RepID=A0A9P0CT06_9CUCU|nr:unnamed protein product [Psylliodes chrysocephala]